MAPVARTQRCQKVRFNNKFVRQTCSDLAQCRPNRYILDMWHLIETQSVQNWQFDHQWETKSGVNVSKNTAVAFTTNFQHDKISYRMKPVSVVIISPGTTRVADAFLEPESDTCFRKVGNLMSAAMLQQWMLFVALVDDVTPRSFFYF